MNLQKVKNFVTSKAGRQILKARKHSPVILFAAGVTGMVGTVVLASRATLKLEDALNDINKDMEIARDAHAMHPEKYTDKDFQRDMTLLYIRSAVKVGKLYGPAFLCGVVSVAALTGSHFILSSRNVALTAAYAAVDKAYQGYRRRVVEEYGEDVDRKFTTDWESCSVVEMTADGEVTREEKKPAYSPSELYGRVFDETNSNWNPQPSYNQMFLQCQQNYANDLLRARGHLFLNEVYDMLGMPRSKAGAIVGWVTGKGDSFVSFGFGDTIETQAFINGDMKSVWLDFNVAGVIYDLIEDKKR